MNTTEGGNCELLFASGANLMLETFTIQEASKKTRVSKHTLRFWEKTFSGIIVPFRTRGGQRRYTNQHLDIIAEIIKMKKKGLTLNDIKEKLDTKSGNDKNKDKIDMLANQIAEVIKESIYNFLSEDK